MFETMFKNKEDRRMMLPCLAASLTESMLTLFPLLLNSVLLGVAEPNYMGKII